MRDALYRELWKACAGPLVDVPNSGERVFYFPQGHMEQVSVCVCMLCFGIGFCLFLWKLENVGIETWGDFLFWVCFDFGGI